jgi:hypothetical protein
MRPLSPPLAALGRALAPALPPLVLAACAALLLPACRSTPPAWLELPPASTQHGVEVVVDGVLRGTTWLKGVTGKATNLSGADLARCTITFDAYSMHGERLGSARAEREELAAGSTWSFKARFPKDINDAVTISAPRVVAVR